jgi:hypothetical protein
MTHELTHDPIKLRLVDIKTGEWIKSVIFVGEVPSDIKKDLLKVQKDYNSGKNKLHSTKLRKFYGKGWKTRLGIIEKKKIKGGRDMKDDIASMNDMIADLTSTVELSDSSDEETEDEKEIDRLKNMNVGDEILDETKSDRIVEEENDNNILQISEEELSKVDDTSILEKQEKTKELKKKGYLEFDFTTDVFPCDNILEFKYKIFYSLKIPIYRQHLWFKYKDKSYPAHYVVNIHKNNVNIDIERLIAFYLGEKEMDNINGIPLELNYYNNKDFLSVSAYDTFNLLHTNYTKYGTTEYFLCDLNDLLDPEEIYQKFKRDRYQLDTIYYGFVILYFPMITYNVYLDYIKNENTLVDLYPDLTPLRSELKGLYTYENDITYESYEALNRAKGIEKNLFSSITGTILSVTNASQDIKLLLILRNLFDLLVLTDTITYCKTLLLNKGKKILLRKAYYNEPEPREV